MMKSKLPVLGPQAPKPSDLPCAKNPQKPFHPNYSKGPVIAFSSTVPDFTMNKKDVSSGRKTVPRKNAPLARGPAPRYKMESELQDQNQLLVAANNTLHNRLLTAQSTIQEMSEEKETMQVEVKELKQLLEKSMIILENRKIDPVSGEQILANAEEMCKTREETKTASDNLLKELKLFSLTAKEQKTLVQTVKAKWKEAEESRSQFLEEQNAFQIDLETFRSSLEETEKWLDL